MGKVTKDTNTGDTPELGRRGFLALIGVGVVGGTVGGGVDVLNNTWRADAKRRTELSEAFPNSSQETRDSHVRTSAIESTVSTGIISGFVTAATAAAVSAYNKAIKPIAPRPQP